MTPAVLVYGTVCLDRFLLVDADGVARPGADWVEMPGGEAFNTATALAGWGVSVALTGTAIGSDAESARLRRLLDTHPLGMPRDFIADLANAVTPVCEIRVFPDGARKMSGRGFRHAIASPIPHHLLAHRPLAVLDENLGDASEAFGLAAAAAGCEIISMDCYQHPALLSVSRVALASREQVGDDARAAALRMRQLGASAAVVTCGADGAVLADERGVRTIDAFLGTPMVDTTGAGDMFRAGLCCGLCDGLTLDDALRFASAAAALHCGVLGGGSRIDKKIISALCQNRGGSSVLRP